MHLLGDLAGARSHHEAVLEVRERTLPEDHPDILIARANVATLMGEMGDQVGARMHLEAVMEVYEKTLAADDRELLLNRGRLAVCMSKMGDLAGARSLFEDLLGSYERTLAPDDLQVVHIRADLAVVMQQMGDLVGARALFEGVLDACERALPEDHPEIMRARTNLGTAMAQMGDLAGARAVYEDLLAAHESRPQPDRQRILRAQLNLAVCMNEMGDLSEARLLFEAVLEARERSLPADHPRLLSARTNLAISASKMGDLIEARDLFAAVLEAEEETLPTDHPDLLAARLNLAISVTEGGDLVGARTLLPALIAGMQTRVVASLMLSPRQARQTVVAEGGRLAGVHFIGELAELPLRIRIFELTETMRLVANEAARSLASHPELAPILDQADELRRAQGDLVARVGRDGRTPEENAADLTRLALERDRLEREASRLLAARGVVTQPVDLMVLAKALGSREIAVGFRRMPHWHQEDGKGEIKADTENLLVHVLSADGALVRIDLGDAAELEKLASGWRGALGAALGDSDSRGIAFGSDSDEDEVATGIRVRERILDPILRAAGADVVRIYVCPDDFIYLLPLDALPLDRAGNERLGDRVTIVSEVSFARMMAPRKPIGASASMLVLGGVEYDVGGESVAGTVATMAPVSTLSGVAPHFQDLPATLGEAGATAELFEEAFEIEPALLTRQATSKAALFATAPGKRYLHLATHGWFAPESVKSTADSRLPESSLARMTVEERVTGFAPMTLCGLALAGANHGADALGRVKGILTAEELCTLDLSGCELAVLSACETNVGIRRAGQGIQSLQSALYAAGARTSITSLWNVDDAATRRLMEIFYTKLWAEKLGKAEALWQAKMVLRNEGRGPRDWAAWVLTGDPN